jgi:hypothetical protein
MLTRYRLLRFTGLLDQYGVPTDDAASHWTASERAQLADEMIAQWQAFKMAGVQPVDHGVALAANIAR